MASLITISRQHGSQGEKVAEEVAWLLKANYLDKEIITLAANRGGIAASVVAEQEEKPGSKAERVLRLVADSLARGAALEVSPYDLVLRFDQGLPTTTDLVDEKKYLGLQATQKLDEKRYLELVTGVMTGLSQVGNAVVMGRGGNMILKDVPNVLRVFVVAPAETRVRRIMEQEHVDAQDAAKRIWRVDSSRKAFVKQLFKADWEDPSNYDLIVNTGRCPVEYAARLIANTAWDWEGQ